MQMLIYLTPQDEIKTMPYKNHDSIRTALEADYYEVANNNIPIGLANQTMSLYVDEEYLIDGTEPICNAYATILCGQPVYGNAVLLMNTVSGRYNEPACRGFETGIPETFSEINFVKSNLENAFKDAELKKAVESLHKEYDGHMPKPQYGIVTFDDVDFLNDQEDLDK